jgi:hypothetical protein
MRLSEKLLSFAPAVRAGDSAAGAAVGKESEKDMFCSSIVGEKKWQPPKN